ncbi:hypothetical protein M514_00235 [Trichuris suis]|uniref:Uncharacterized protein n=1 Tax=Trichuris suis TaxID=68888 RepID=A0A085NED8_9BILA|nr:hypothetical protein M513_00235 [Trichuris suis]KFD67834.1 hypothetical protein M514_00235 [Trichuris suis]
MRGFNAFEVCRHCKLAMTRNAKVFVKQDFSKAQEIARLEHSDLTNRRQTNSARLDEQTRNRRNVYIDLPIGSFQPAPVAIYSAKRISNTLTGQRRNVKYSDGICILRIAFEATTLEQEGNNGPWKYLLDCYRFA